MTLLGIGMRGTSPTPIHREHRRCGGGREERREKERQQGENRREKRRLTGKSLSEDFRGFQSPGGRRGASLLAVRQCGRRLRSG